MKQEARRREAEMQEARSQKQEVRGKKSEARSQKQEAKQSIFTSLPLASLPLCLLPLASLPLCLLPLASCFFASLLLASLPLPLAHAQDSGLAITAQAQVRPSTTVPVAEQAQIEITITSNQKLIVSSVPVLALNDFHILKTEIVQAKENAPAFKSKIIFDFIPLNAGDLTFPSLEISCMIANQSKTEVQSPPVKIAVINPIGPMASPMALKDIKGPIPIGGIPWLWITTITILGVAGVFLWQMYRRRQLAAASLVPAVPSRPPDEIAFEKLKVILENYHKNEDTKIFYSELSNIFREYLGHQFKIEALEKTTVEIFSAMRNQQVDRKICLQTKDVLSNCDLVKFAKFIPTEKQVLEDFNAVQTFIQSQKVVA